MTRLFEEKTAKDGQFQYDGETKGTSWRSDTFDYFISMCPDAQPWLEWAERQGAVEISPAAIDQEKRNSTLMTEMCPYVLSHHVWVFLQHSLSGSSRQTFKNTKRRDGLNVWRLLVLEVNSQHGLPPATSYLHQPGPRGRRGMGELVQRVPRGWRTAYGI